MAKPERTCPMAKRVPPSKRTGQRIRGLLREGVSEGEDLKSEFMKLAVRQIIEETLEGEVRDVIGRGYYEHSAGEPQGYRNGYRKGHLKTAEGVVDYSAPQVSDREEPFHSMVREVLKGRTEELERLAVEMYARGLSTRDIEDAFRDRDGVSVLSKTAVSEVTEKLWEEYEGFATRDLSDLDLVYVFLDGVAERLRPGQRREAVLCAWGIDLEGRKHLVHLAPGTKEDTASVKAFLQDLKRRGLADPLLAITDGGGGLIRGVEEVLPRADRQRCLAHKMRNLQSKVPEPTWPEFKEHVNACYHAPTREVAEVLKDTIVQEYEDQLPSAIACFLEDFDACVVHLKYPLAHRKAIRTTNMLERLFEEDRRRTKVIPHAFGERPLLKLMFAAVIRASERWRGLKMTVFERSQLKRIREEQDEEFTKKNRPAAKKRSSRSRVSSKKRA